MKNLVLNVQACAIKIEKCMHYKLLILVILSNFVNIWSLNAYKKIVTDFSVFLICDMYIFFFIKK